MAATTHIRIKEFTFDEFKIIKEVLIEWNYEWLEYDIIYESENENVDLTFYIDEDVISMSEFIYLIFCLGHESAFRR